MSSWRPGGWRVWWHREVLGHDVELVRQSEGHAIWLDNDCLRKFTVRVRRARTDIEPL